MENRKTFMRVDKNLLNEIKACKIADRESYASVIKRIMHNNAFVKSRLEQKLRKKAGL